MPTKLLGGVMGTKVGRLNEFPALWLGMVATVPHCLRGMALGQLQHLDRLFLQSGWLQAQCDTFNTDNANAILRGERFKQRPNLYLLGGLLQRFFLVLPPPLG